MNLRKDVRIQGSARQINIEVSLTFDKYALPVALSRQYMYFCHTRYRKLRRALEIGVFDRGNRMSRTG